MAKKPMISVPYDVVACMFDADTIVMRFQKKVKGGHVTVGKVQAARKDKAGLTDKVAQLMLDLDV